jgi:hypothetical protein
MDMSIVTWVMPARQGRILSAQPGRHVRTRAAFDLAQ